MALSPVRPGASISAGSADTIAFTRSYSPALIASMNAASVSTIDGLYLPNLRGHKGYRGHKRCFVVFFASFVPFVSLVSAQSTPDRGERPPIGSTLTAGALADLPSGGNLFTLLDT